MPFKKVGNDDYTGPSGKHFNLNQVRLYYAGGGKFPGQKHSEGGPVNGYAKGGNVQSCSYAAGGPVLGRTRNFMKEPDEFRDPDHANPGADDDQLYGKSGEGKGNGMCGGAPPAKGKSLSAVKPRK